MPASRRFAEFNKRVTNRVQRIWAPYLPPFAMIVHKGRKSGREYRNPVIAHRSHDHKLGVVLYYGAHADWVRNVLAAGEAEVIRLGRTHRLTGPTVVEAADPALSRRLRHLARPNRQVLLGDLTD